MRQTTTAELPLWGDMTRSPTGFRTAGIGAFRPLPWGPGEGPFSIAASVKLRPDDFMLAAFVLWLMMPHGALASLRGRRKAAS